MLCKTMGKFFQIFTIGALLGAMVWLTAEAAPMKVFVAGPRAGTFCSTASPGQTSWRTLDGALQPYDGLFARSVGLYIGESTTKQLRVSGFGFHLPKWAVPIGIKAAIRHRALGGLVSDWDVTIINGVGNPCAYQILSTPWPSYFDYTVIGSQNDLWHGSVWLQDINSFQFGISIRARLPERQSADVDDVKLTVYYTK